MAQGLDHDAFEVGVVQRHCAGSRAEEIRTAGFEQVVVGPDDLAEPAAESVADHGVAGRLADRVRDRRRRRVGTPQDSDRDRTRAVATGPGEGTE